MKILYAFETKSIEDKTTNTMDDSTVLTFGKFKGTKLADVPAWYLLYIYDNFTNLDNGLREYIKSNMKQLSEEFESAKDSQKRNYKARD